MKTQLTHISIHQSSKVIAILYLVVFALISIPLGIYTAVTDGLSNSLFIFIAPFFYMFFGYIGFAIVAFFYNLVASTFGGIEFTYSGCICQKDKLEKGNE